MIDKKSFIHYTYKLRDYNKWLNSFYEILGIDCDGSWMERINTLFGDLLLGEISDIEYDRYWNNLILPGEEITNEDIEKFYERNYK